MFVVHKYTPKDIEDFDYNRKIAETLLLISKDNCIPHIILHGPIGSGKESLANFFLRKLYNDNVQNLRKSKYEIKGSSNKKEVTIIGSNFHIVIEPTNTNHDKYIIQEIIHSYAE